MTFNTDQEAYRALRDIVAEGTQRLVVWCGSGLSVPAGLPNWAQLRSAISAAQRDKVATMQGEDGLKLHAQVEQIARIDNPWVAFEKLQELGPTTFRETIRHALRAAATSPIPSYYRSLWSLRVAAVLNLNLDRLATRAYSDRYPGRLLTEFTGGNIANHLQVLRDPQPFVVNLHGTTDDVSTWIFTYSQLQALRKNEAYTGFIRLCLSAYTVLFLGVSADDIAVGGHLETVKQLGMDVGTHYWLTDRRDAGTDSWAETNGIRVIRYRSSGTDHTDIDGFFEDLLKFVPPDEPAAPPVVPDPAGLPALALPSPLELVLEDADTIRATLNRQAGELLALGTPEAYAKYDRFIEEYDEAVHRAWYTSTAPGRNHLLGYTLEAEIARGAFGRVYRARDNDGHRVALKVLLGEVRNHSEFLQSFRRGVRSMEILERHQVKGMVAYKQASEIPAFVVMELIEGPNLKQAVESRAIVEWHDVLQIAFELAAILHRAHSLPERVLHRDVRPANVMLKNYWADKDEWEVVMLDFDLSWHRGAYEQSVVQNTGIAGYLAPEQIRALPGVSTRHAGVDSFGLGMTLYFMISQSDPVPNQHLHAEWQQTVKRSVGTFPASKWRSLGNRFARLIVALTRNAQSERWDMSQVLNEVARIRDAHLNPEGVRAADLLSEEIVAKCRLLDSYEWLEDQVAAQVSLPSGVRLRVQGDESARRVWLRLEWQDRGNQERKRVGRWIPSALEAAASQLARGGWGGIETDQSQATMRLSAFLDADFAALRLDKHVQAATNAVAAMRFE